MAGSGGVYWRRVLFGGFVALTAVSLALGYWGLLLKAGDVREYRTGWRDIVYWDLQLFVLDSAPAQDGHAIPWPLQVARFTAPAATAYALARTAQVLLERRVTRWQAQRSRGHVVVCGVEPAAATLARELLRKGEKVVVVGPGVDDPSGLPPGAAEPSAPPPGARLVVGDARSEDVLRRAGIARAREVMAVTSDSAFNAEVGLAVQDLVDRERENRAGQRAPWWRWRWWPRRPGGTSDLTCHAEIADRQVCAAMAARVWHDPVRRGRLHFFSRHDRAAGDLVDRSPLGRGLRHPGDPAAASVLIVGSGQLAQAVLLELGRLWDQQVQVWRERGLGPGRLPLRVVDPVGHLEAQLARLPVPREALALTVDVVDPRSLTTAGRLRVPLPSDGPATPDPAGFDAAGACDPAHVFVCLDDDLATLRFGLVATDLLPQAHVVAAVTSGTVFGQLLGAGGDAAMRGTGGRLILHNVIGTVYQSDSVRRDHLEDMARAGHRAYVAAAMARGETEEDNPSMVPWDRLPDDLRRSNRAQAADVERKLAEIGCEVGPAAEEFTFTDDEVEHLARQEHQRWMAERVDEGWTYAAERDNERKHHDKLVPWDDLSETDQEKDRTAVRAIPAFFTGGLGIVRGRPTGG